MNDINTEKSMWNILQILQTQPWYYKRFGIYWFHIKALMKEYFNKDNLYLLGDYQDESVMERVPDMETNELLKTAFEEYTHNVAFGREDKTVEDTEGQILVIYDEDAGI